MPCHFSCCSQGRKKLTQLESGRAKKKKVASTGAAAVAHGGYASGGGGVAAKAAVETSEYVVIDIDEEDRQTDLLKSKLPVANWMWGIATFRKLYIEIEKERINTS